MAVNFRTSANSASYDPPFQGKNTLEGSEMTQRQRMKQIAEQIKAIKGRVYCFIGKTANEPLPTTEGAIWISADIEYISKAYEEPVPPERIHIQGDFNEPDTEKSGLIEINHLLDTVVVDKTTCHFFTKGDFISRFAKLLKPSSDSTLIFEVSPYLCQRDPAISSPENHYGVLCLPPKDLKDKIDYYQLYREKTGPEQVEQEFLQYVQQRTSDPNLRSREKYQKDPELLRDNFKAYVVTIKMKIVSYESQMFEWARNDTQRHLEELFKDVKRLNDIQYPYLTRVCIADVFVAKKLS